MAKLTARSKLGDWLVTLKLVSRKSVKDALKAARPGELLGQTLVRTGVLERALLEKVAEIQRRFKQTARENSAQSIEFVLDEKSFIGDILVALGSISIETKQQWLDYQSEKRARGEDPGRLGELLVQNQVCSREQRDLAMKVQDWLRGV
jgi:hypothetical protein